MPIRQIFAGSYLRVDTTFRPSADNGNDLFARNISTYVDCSKRFLSTAHEMLLDILSNPTTWRSELTVIVRRG
jgi:hypothetical protein